MHSIDTKTASKLPPRPEDKQSNNELLATSALTMLSAMIMGTVAFVGIHHRYRKQRQPDARLQDYVVGIRSQLQSLTSTRTPQLARFSYACQQAATAWQHAYHLSLDDRQNTNYHSVADISALHTTTVLTRPICWVSGVASMPKNSALANDEQRADNDLVWSVLTLIDKSFGKRPCLNVSMILSFSLCLVIKIVR